MKTFIFYSIELIKIIDLKLYYLSTLIHKDRHWSKLFFQFHYLYHLYNLLLNCSTRKSNLSFSSIGEDKSFFLLERRRVSPPLFLLKAFNNKSLSTRVGNFDQILLYSKLKNNQ